MANPCASMTYRRLPLRPSLAKSVRWCATLLTRISSKISRPASDLRTAAHFELRGRAITAEDMRGIASLLIGNKQLESLDLAANGFGEDGANACADILSACPTLTTLILDNNNIRAGVAVLSEKVAVHTGVRNLSLAANVIGPRASIAVADALAANTSLEQCSLASNAFGYKGGVAVGEALMRSAGTSKLQSLDLSACGVAVEGAVGLADALSGESGHRLSSIDMQTNFVGPEGVAAFAAMLATNTTLQVLSLSDNNIGQLGDRQTGTCGQALADALAVNTTLRVLDLTYNGLSQAATETLIAAKEGSDARREKPLELRL